MFLSSLGRRVAVVLSIACVLQPAAATVARRQPRSGDRRSEPRIVDLERPEDVPQHLLFTVPIAGVPTSEMRSADGSSEPALWVIMYQTNMSLAPLGTFLFSQLTNGTLPSEMQPEVLGQGTEWSGFSTKHHLAVRKMKKLDPNDLVVLSDFGDVVLNLAEDKREKSIQEFKKNLMDMLNGSAPGTIVVSAEAQCCVAALSYHKPGDLVDNNWQRVERACDSGQPQCLGTDDPGTTEWQEFMEDLALVRGHRDTKYPYLNAGLMAGRVKDMIAILESLQLEDQEDDQAVMTDLLYASPASITLDYDQRLFGNARWAMPGNRGCVFDWDEEDGTFRQQDTGTRPMFIHTSGKYFSCLRKVAMNFGWVSSMAGSEFSAAARRGFSGTPAAAAAAVLLAGMALSRI